MSSNSQTKPFPNHVILAIVIFASTFMSWLDTFGMGKNLWEVASGMRTMAKFSNDNRAWIPIIILYCVPLSAGGILLAHFQNRASSARRLSVLCGALLLFIAVIIFAQSNSNTRNSFFGAIFSPGLGAYLAMVSGVLMLLNYFGMLGTDIVKFAGKLASGSKTPAPSAENSGDLYVKEKFSVEIPLNTKLAKDATTHSVNVLNKGFEEAKIVADKNGIMSLFAGVLIGILLMKQPWIAAGAVVAFIVYCGTKRTAETSSATPLAENETTGN